MAGINPVDDAKLSSGMMALVRRFKDDSDYVNGLKIFAHKPGDRRNYMVGLCQVAR